MQACDGIDQDAKSMEDEGEEDNNEHEEDQEDEQEEEVEEDNGDVELEDYPSEQFGSKGNFVESPLPKEKQPIKHKVVKIRLKTIGKTKPIHLKVSTHSGCALVLPSNTPMKGKAPKTLSKS